MTVEHSEDDALIGSLIDAATDLAQQFTGQHFMMQTVDVYFDAFGCELLLPLRPIVDATVYYQDSDDAEQTLAGSEYYEDLIGFPGRVVPRFSFPGALERPNAVRVECDVGYADADSVPAAIKQAILLAVGNWYENRESTVAGTIASPVPFGFEALLTAHRFIVL